MGLGYDPNNARITGSGFTVKYVVNATGDRWFIPYNENASKSDQVSQCNTIAGHTADDSDVASEQVAS